MCADNCIPTHRIRNREGVSFCVGALAQRTTHGFELTDVLSFGCGSDWLLQGGRGGSAGPQAQEGLPGWWAPTRQGQPQPQQGCPASPRGTRTPTRLHLHGIGGTQIWLPSATRPHMRDEGCTEHPQPGAWGPAATAVLGGCWSCSFGSFVCQFWGEDLHHWAALCQSGKRDCSS